MELLDRRKSLFLCLLLYFVASIGAVATACTDSLFTSTEDEVVRIHHLIKKGNDFVDMYNIDSILWHVKQIRSSSQAIAYEIGISEADLIMGYMVVHDGFYDSARTYAERAMEVFQKHNYQIGIAKSLRLTGTTYDYEGDYVLALKYYHEGLDTSESHSLVFEIPRSLNNIGLVHLALGDHDLSLKNLLESYEVNMDDLSSLSTLYNIGGVFAEKALYDSSLYYLNKALKGYQKYNDQYGVAYVLMGMSICYMGMKNYDLATTELKKALDISIAVENEPLVMFIKGQLASAYHKNGQPYKSIELAKQAYEWAISVNEKETIQLASRQLFESHATVGDYETAFEYQSTWKSLNDSIINADNIKLIATYSLEQEHIKSQQAKEILLQEDRLVQEAELKKEKLYRNISIIAFLIAVLMVVIIYQSYILKIRANRTLREKNELINQQKNVIAGFVENLEKKVEKRTVELNRKNRKLHEYAHMNSNEIRGPLSKILELTRSNNNQGGPMSLTTKSKIVDKIYYSANALDEVVKSIGKKLDE